MITRAFLPVISGFGGALHKKTNPILADEVRFLNDMVEEGGFEPPKRNVTDLQSAPFGHSGTPPY